MQCLPAEGVVAKVSFGLPLRLVFAAPGLHLGLGLASAAVGVLAAAGFFIATLSAVRCANAAKIALVVS